MMDQVSLIYYKTLVGVLIQIIPQRLSVLSRSATIPPDAKGPRIVNGDLAGEYDWPWQVGLREQKWNGQYE